MIYIYIEKNKQTDTHTPSMYLDVVLAPPPRHRQRRPLRLGESLQVADQVAPGVPQLVGEVAVGLHPG